MTSKERLQRYWRFKVRESHLEKEIKNSYSAAFRKTSYGDNESISNDEGIEEKYCKLAKKIKEKEMELEYIRKEIDLVENVLDELAKTHKEEVDAMLMKYIYRKRLKEIGEEMKWSRTTTNRKIKEVEKMFEEYLK